MCGCFNPRAREGRDAEFLIFLHEPRVSIHAPARGATKFCWNWDLRIGFQSTRPRGARHYFGCSSVCFDGFNPRAREGRDTSAGGKSFFSMSFNPRAREGRDHL